MVLEQGDVEDMEGGSGCWVPLDDGGGISPDAWENGCDDGASPGVSPFALRGLSPSCLYAAPS